MRSYNTYLPCLLNFDCSADRIRKDIVSNVGPTANVGLPVYIIWHSYTQYEDQALACPTKLFSLTVSLYLLFSFVFLGYFHCFLFYLFFPSVLSNFLIVYMRKSRKAASGTEELFFWRSKNSLMKFALQGVAQGWYHCCPEKS